MRVLGPPLAFGVFGDVEPDGVPVGIALHRYRKEPFGGRKAAEPATNASFDNSGISDWMLLERRVGFVQFSAQPLAGLLQHRCFLFTPHWNGTGCTVRP